MAGIKTGIIGIGGFAQNHIQILRTAQKKGKVELVAACDSRLHQYGSALTGSPFRNLRLYEDFERFLQSEKGLDLLIIVTPIPLHKEMCCRALVAGNNVLIEKPPAVTLQDLDEMIGVKERTGKICAVGFQNTSAKSFIALMEWIRQGKIGTVKRIKAAGIWKRTHEYYTRSPWVGKLRYQGSYVLDGPVFNALAHLLNNCMYIARIQEKNTPLVKYVQAELYRANRIESQDTASMRAVTCGGIEILFFCSLCNDTDQVPYILVEGTCGKAIWDYNGLIQRYNAAGELVGRQNLSSNPYEDHFDNLLSHIADRKVQLNCSLEDTRDFVLSGNLAFESSRQVYQIDSSHVEVRMDTGYKLGDAVLQTSFVYIKEIETIIQKGINESKLFSELGLEWAVATKSFCSDAYKTFGLFLS